MPGSRSLGSRRRRTDTNTNNPTRKEPHQKALFLPSIHRCLHPHPDVPDSDDATGEKLSFTVADDPDYAFDLEVPCETTPGTALGTGERFNMPRPEVSTISINPLNAEAGQVIEISEVRHTKFSGTCRRILQ